MAKILTVEFIEDYVLHDDDSDDGYEERSTFVDSKYVPLTSRAEHLLELMTAALETQEVKVSDETFEKNLCVLKLKGESLFFVSSQRVYSIEEVDPIVGIRGEKEWDINFCIEELATFFGKIPKHIYIKA